MRPGRLPVPEKLLTSQQSMPVGSGELGSARIQAVQALSALQAAQHVSAVLFRRPSGQFLERCTPVRSVLSWRSPAAQVSSVSFSDVIAESDMAPAICAPSKPALGVEVNGVGWDGLWVQRLQAARCTRHSASCTLSRRTG